MSIDWITVSAQAVNFLILVWLLKRFLYRPVLRAMDTREQHISARLEAANQREQEARSVADDYRERQDALNGEREALLVAAREAAEQQRNRMLEEARAEVLATRADWQHQVSQEKDEFVRNLQHRVATVVQAIAHRALAHLADVDLETRVAERFIQHLDALDDTSRRTLADGPVHVRSAFELTAPMRDRLTRAVHECLDKTAEVHYVRSADLICGIELSSGGQRVSWSVANDLDDLRERIEEAFAAVEPPSDGR
jgi:F-type H+-transporting ATPase subunit b